MIADLPPEWEEDTLSVRELTVQGEKFYLLLSTEEREQYAPDIEEKQRTIYLKENEKQPLYLYMYPADGDLSKTDIVRECITDVTFEMISLEDGSVPLVIEDFSRLGGEAMNRLAVGEMIAMQRDIASYERPLHALVTVTVTLKEAGEIPVSLCVTLVPQHATLIPGTQHPMRSAEELNRLIDQLDEKYGPDIPITLMLPAQVYREEILIGDRAVNLSGAAGKTVFGGGLHIAKSKTDAYMHIQGIIFQGNGEETAITSERSFSLHECEFYDYASCYSVPEGAMVTGEAIKGNTTFVGTEQTGAAMDLTTSAGLNAFLAAPTGEFAQLESFAIMLPGVTYTEEIVVPRSISLVGSDDGKTVFARGVRYVGEGPEVMIRNCTFINKDEREAAVRSERELLIKNCNIYGFTYAGMPVGDGKIGFIDCNFDGTVYLFPE